MAMSTIKITYGSEDVILRCDLDDAAADLVVDGVPIGHNTASVRHRRPLAVARACRFAWPGADWPTVPHTGPIADDWCSESRAWNEVEYWDLTVST